MNHPGYVSSPRRPNHDGLQDQLLRYLAGQSKRAVWGEIMIGKTRPDAYAVDIVRDEFVAPHIYEVKAERSDFANEIRTGKWRKYLEHCTRFDFVTVPDICHRSEIPDQAGWLVYEDGAFKRKKRAQKRDAQVPKGFLLKVALYRTPHMPVGRAWTVEQWVRHLERRRKIGREVAIYLRDKERAEADLLRARADVKDLEAKFLRLQAAEKCREFATSDLFENPILEHADVPAR